MRSRAIPMFLGLVLGLPLLAVLGATVGVQGRAEAAPGVRPTLSLHIHSNGRVRLTGRTATRSEALFVERYNPSTGAYENLRRIRSDNYRFSYLVDARTVRTIYAVRSLTQHRRGIPRGVNPRYDACGLRPLQSNGTLYDCTFVDNFSGTTLDTSKWFVHAAETPVSGNTSGAAACYSPDNVSVSGGTLNLVTRYASLLECPGLLGALKILTSGQVSTYRKYSQKYGRFEARTRNTATKRPGLHEAFWLWPDDRVVDVTKWPVSGEIDVAETYSAYPNLSIPFIHSRYDAYGQVLAGPNANTAWTCEAKRGEWNTYRVDWTSSRIEIYVNDKLCLTHTSGDAAFDQPYIIALTQLVGSQNNNFNILLPPTIPATYEIDYVRAWEK